MFSDWLVLCGVLIMSFTILEWLCADDLVFKVLSFEFPFDLIGAF